MRTIFSLVMILFIVSGNSQLFAQTPFTKTANEVAGKYEGNFLYGSNMAWKNNWWSDGDVGDLLIGNPEKGRIGVGANSVRPALFHYFTEKYGYESRIPHFKHYKSVGAETNVIFIGGRPSEESQENAYYCKDDKGNIIKKDDNGYSLQSKLYRNMYEPIWVTKDGKSVINEKNDYAHYVYRLVAAHKDYCLFYEIINEPDFTYTGVGNKEPGEDWNWWENDPKPRDLNNLFSPLQHYVRILRISYEVIKTVQPEALVCIGGIGYNSFLDAVLRMTDNPDGGKVTEQYPLTGGAWFDCLSYHLYPMYFIREWVGRDVPGNIDGFRHFRHTDAAVEYTLDRKRTMEAVLAKYGYDGVKYPMKEVILTETNIPNKQVKTFIGGETEQRNFLMKLAVLGQKEGIKGVYPFAVWDDKEQNENGGEYDYKGFYYPIPEKPTEGTLRMHESATGWRTTSNLLGGKSYNERETERLNLPDNIDGAAFGEGDDIIFTLWAKTSIDLNESASAEYTFQGMGIDKIRKIRWNGVERQIDGAKVELTGEVDFFQLNTGANIPEGWNPAILNIYKRGDELCVDADDVIKKLEMYSMTGQLLHRSSPNKEFVAINTVLPPMTVVSVRATFAKGADSKKICVK